MYRNLQPRFSVLAQRGWLSLPLVVAVALMTFLRVNRRLPDRSAGSPGPSRIGTAINRVAERSTGANPEAQAGFFFALQTLGRSVPHRTIVAIAVASGLTYALIAIADSGRYLLDVAALPTGVFGISTALLLSVLGGVAYAVTVPAEPAANWLIRMAWLGDERAYLAGVKGAALTLAVMVLLVLLPLHLALFGPTIAAVHSIFGLLLASAALDALFLPYRRLPFACSYVPIENPKLAWPAVVSAWLSVTYGCASAERWAFVAAWRTGGAMLALAALAVLMKALDRWRRRNRRPVVFDRRPVPITQCLGLFEHGGDA